MSGCKKYLSGCSEKKKEDLLMAFAFKCSKIIGFFSFDESDDKLISIVTAIDHSISNENINNETNINCKYFRILTRKLNNEHIHTIIFIIYYV